MTNKLSKLLSVGEPEVQNGWNLALCKMENLDEGYVFYKSSKEIDEIIRPRIGQEVPYALNKAKDGSKTLMTIYMSDEVKKEEPKKGYAETQSAKKQSFYEGKEQYWVNKEEREIARQEVNDIEFSKRHYQNLIAPFYLSLLKDLLDNSSAISNKEGEFVSEVIDSMIEKANQLHKDAQSR